MAAQTDGARPATGEELDLIQGVAACALEGEEVDRQKQRHAEVGRSVSGVLFDGDSLKLDFDESLDRATLDELIAVEARCCPFFTMGYDERSRRLTVSVDGAEFRPALEAVAERLRAPAAPPAAG